MQIKTSILGSFWVLFLWKLDLQSPSRSMSAGEGLSPWIVHHSLLERPFFFFFLRSNSSRSCVYKHCQQQRVLGIFHLKEKWQKEWSHYLTCPWFRALPLCPCHWGFLLLTREHGVTWCQQFENGVHCHVCLSFLINYVRPLGIKVKSCLNYFDMWCSKTMYSLTKPELLVC